MFPHTQPLVLHAPKLCRYCDKRPSWQQSRIDQNINFTGEHDPAKEQCPAEQERPLEWIYREPGNRPFRPIEGFIPVESVKLAPIKPPKSTNPNPRGMKVTDAQVREMRRKFDEEGADARSLALEYGIHPYHARAIVMRRERIGV
jgi:hypothetical protein